MKIRPLQDRIMVQPILEKEVQKGGIIIPDSAKEKPQKGIVVAVGPGTSENPVTVKVGNHVLYGKYAGTELQHNGSDYMIMKESDILAIV